MHMFLFGLGLLFAGIGAFIISCSIVFLSGYRRARLTVDEIMRGDDLAQRRQQRR